MFKFQKAKEIRYGKVKDRLSIRCKWSNRGRVTKLFRHWCKCSLFSTNETQYKRKGREKALENSNIMADKDLPAN